MEDIMIGRKIKTFREMRNFTQEYMAEQLEMSVAGYSRIERDEVGININKLIKIASVLKVDITQILDFNDKQTFYNYGTTGDNSFSVHNHLSQQIFKKFEDEVTNLKEEIIFLRSLVREQEKGNTNPIN